MEVRGGAGKVPVPLDGVLRRFVQKDGAEIIPVNPLRQLQILSVNAGADEHSDQAAIYRFLLTGCERRPIRHAAPDQARRRSRHRVDFLVARIADPNMRGKGAAVALRIVGVIKVIITRLARIVFEWRLDERSAAAPSADQLRGDPFFPVLVLYLLRYHPVFSPGFQGLIEIGDVLPDQLENHVAAVLRERPGRGALKILQTGVPQQELSEISDVRIRLVNLHSGPVDFWL